MSKISADALDLISGHKRNRSRKQALARRLSGLGMGRSELAQLLAHVLHESGAFRYVQEVWAPTKAQLGYEGRADLGNTEPGDGRRFRGRDLLQVTGRANYRDLTRWARARYPDAPDFERWPDKLISAEWLGLGVIWYWSTRVPRRLIERGDLRAITRRINGGLNGLADRQRWYARAALVLLGYGPDDARSFQTDHGLKPDGIAGPKTRAALHAALVQADGASSSARGQPSPAIITTAIAVAGWLALSVSSSVCGWPWLAALLSMSCGGSQ